MVPVTKCLNMRSNEIILHPGAIYVPDATESSMHDFRSCLRILLLKTGWSHIDTVGIALKWANIPVQGKE